MCGIMGAYCAEGVDAAAAGASLTTLRHRGPDAQDSRLLEGGRLYLGHTRLKIIDLSDQANQPFVSACGRYTLVFNGEIYNFRQLRQEIGSVWPWRTEGDGEVLLALFALYGEAMLERLNGMFAFAIHDRERRRLFLCRDRFGIKPLYYLWRGRDFFFASEIPPLLSHAGRVEPDLSTIRTYLETGLYDFCEHTFFEGVKALEGGCRMVFDLSTGWVKTKRWYRLADHVPDLSGMIDQREALEEAERLVERAIAEQLVADVAVGLNVSGGVDSSMLVRVAVAQLGHAHLFAQDYPEYSELPWVGEISEGGTLHVAELDLDRITGYLEETVRAQAEPFGGVFVCGYNALYEAARRQDITVLLDGNGVDESFLGYKRYHQIYATTAIDAAERRRRTGEFEVFWGHPPQPLSSGASIDGTYGLRPEVLGGSLLRSDLLRAPSVDGFSDPVRQAAAEDLLYAKIPRGLRFNDRVSMAHSCELRVPYLDHRLVEFAFGVPSTLLLNDRGSKALFREVLAMRAPPAVAYARKRSVQSPQREWLANGWRTMVESILTSERFAGRGWIEPVAARRAYQEYLAGSRENSFFIWQWVGLELWARAFLDGGR